MVIRFLKNSKRCGLIVVYLSSLLCLQACGGKSAAPVAKDSAPVDPAESSSLLDKDQIGDAALLPDSELKKMSLANLKEVYKNRAEQDIAEEIDMLVYKTINEQLCSRIMKVRSECAVAQQITGSANTSDELQCGGGQSQTSTASRKLTAQLFADDSEAASGDFILEVQGGKDQGIYLSSTFKKGVEADISFKPLVAQSAKSVAPQFRNLTVISIKKQDGSALPNKNSMRLVLKMGDSVLIDGIGLVPSEATEAQKDKKYIYPLSKIVNLAESEACLVTADEVDNLKNAIRTDVRNKKGPATVSNFSGQKNALIINITKIKKKISDRQAGLEDARNRLLKLTAELTPDSLFGCYANQPIQTLRIELDGRPLPARNLAKSFKDPFSSTGNPLDSKIELGSAVSVNINSLQHVGGYWEGPVPNTLISNIEYLKITKGGIGYRSDQTCTSQLILAETCSYKVQEENMYSLTGITVKVNGIIIYSNKNLDLIFGDDQNQYKDPRSIMTWSAPTFRSNENWVKLMQRTDCDATH
ncbi:MAG: hypothetical protein KA436_02115 [Oligoflexales bacterium]|nr:hypothetical protein [Oligoflexales bacterium]